MAERTAQVVAVDRLDEEVLEVVARLVDPPALPYRSGQFVSLYCGDDAEGRPIRRSYTMMNAPAPPHDRLELCVRTIASGAGSAFVKRLAPGDELHFTGPMGFFVLDEQHRGDLVLVATGIGMVGLLPMIDELLAAPRGRLRVLWGCRSAAEARWAAPRLAALPAPPTLCLDPSWESVHEQLRGTALAGLDELAEPAFYLCGNGDMIRAVRGALTERGLDRKRRVRSEAFFPQLEP